MTDTTTKRSNAASTIEQMLGKQRVKVRRRTWPFLISFEGKQVYINKPLKPPKFKGEQLSEALL